MADEEPNSQKTDTAHRSGGLLGSVTGVVGWFASSLGVIGALLYACGYLISVAQLHLLGLGRVMTYGHDYYVQAGGLFLADIGSIAATAAEWFSIILIVFAALALGAVMLWRKCGLRHRKWIDRILSLRTRVENLWRCAAYAVLLGLLLFRYGDPKDFGSPLVLSNVLFPDPSTAMAPDLVKIQNYLLVGDQDHLGGVFEQRLTTYLAAGLLFLGAHYVTVGWQWRRLAMTPFMIIFTLYTLLLPMLYGVLKLQVRFPVVMIWPGEGAKPADGQRSFLLNLDEHEVVLYVAADRKVLWRRPDHIDRLDVIGEASILKEIPARKVTP